MTTPAQTLGQIGREDGPKREPAPKEDTKASRFREHRSAFRPRAGSWLLLICKNCSRIRESRDGLRSTWPRRGTPRPSAKVLLNALYLQSQGKLQNGPGVHPRGDRGGIRPAPPGGTAAGKPEAGAGDPFTHDRGEAGASTRGRRHVSEEEAAINLVLGSLRPEELQRAVQRAVEHFPSRS